MHNYYTQFIYILLSFLAYYIIKSLYQFLRHRYLIKYLKDKEFNPKWEEIIIENLPHYSKLSKRLQTKLKFLVMLFIEEKEFIGVGKMVVTDEVRVTIASYASLMILNVKNTNYYEDIKTILVYKLAFIVDEVKSYGGVYAKERFVLEGFASKNVVVIAWNEAKREAIHPHFGRNVIIHEFAHQLDLENGVLSGTPPLDNSSQYREWANILSLEYKRLKTKVLQNRFFGKYSLIGRYASTNEAEFFAVLSELFFERPKDLKRDFPMLYKELKSFYKIDMSKIL